jgi:hypothetical protein
VYYITQYAGDEIVAQEAFAVNLASQDESSLQPNRLPGLPVGAQPAGQTVPVQESPFRRELWPYVAVFGFVILLAEWFLAQRITLRRVFLAWRSRRAIRRLSNS